MMKLITCIITSVLLLGALFQYFSLQQKEHTIYDAFTPNFFRGNRATYFIGIDKEQLYGNTYELIKTIDKIISYNLDVIIVDDDSSKSDENIQYNLLNENKTQFAFVNGYFLNKIKDKKNIRLVCGLNRVPVNLLSCVLDLNTLSDLKGSGLTINIGVANSMNQLISYDLFVENNLIIGEDIKITNYGMTELLDHYDKDVHVALLCLTNPDRRINRLVNTKLTKFLNIDMTLSGTLENDGKFYKNHPHHIETQINKSMLLKYYPNIVTSDLTFPSTSNNFNIRTQSGDIYTLGYITYLLSNKYVPSTHIFDVLTSINKNINVINNLSFVDRDITSSDLANFVSNIPTHDGAKQYFMNNGSYTNIDNKNCIMIDGACTINDLHRHHYIE